MKKQEIEYIIKNKYPELPIQLLHILTEYVKSDILEELKKVGRV